MSAEDTQLIIDAPAVAPARRRRPVVVALVAAGVLLFAATAASTSPRARVAMLVKGHGHDGSGPVDDSVDDVVLSVDDASVVYTSVPTQMSVRNAPMPGPAPTPAVTPIPGTPVPTSVVTNTPSYDCPSTCESNTCSHYYETYGYSCHTMESEYGCDCSGCACS